MPQFIVQQGAMVMCPHGGPAVSAAPSLRVFVGGAPIMTMAPPLNIVCPQVPPPPPCTVGKWTSGAVRLSTMGQPVVLANSTGVCPPNGPLQTRLTQLRVQGT
jgi:hypothetical protein